MVSDTSSVTGSSGCVTKPYPRTRLNHLTSTGSNSPAASASALRSARSPAGMDERGCGGKAVERSIEMTFFAWSPRCWRTGTTSMIAPSGTLLRPCSRSTLKWSSTSPSSPSQTRKPKPRVASNHFTRPVTGGSSDAEGASAESISGRASPSAALVATRTTESPLSPRRFVGKPTFKRQLTAALGKFLKVDVGAGREGDNGAGEAESMAGADHRAERFLPLFGIAYCRSGKGAEPAPFGEAQRGRDGLGLRMLPRCRAVLLRHSRRAQLLEHTPFAVAAPRQRLGLGQRIGRVVDIPLLGKAVGNAGEIGLARAVPAAFADLAREIGAQLRPRRRKSPDVTQRELIQPALVERRRRSSCSHDALFVPHSPTIQEVGCSCGPCCAQLQGKGRRARAQRLSEKRACAAGRDTDHRYAPPPSRRFRDDRRSPRLSRQGP